VIWLRVLFTALPVLSLGFFAWGSLLRLALVRKNALDWALMAIDAVLIICAYIMVGMASDDGSWQSNVGTMSVLVVMFGTPAYFLIADIRFWSAVPQGYAMPPGPPAGYMAQSPYSTGYGPMGGGIPRPAPMPQQGPMPQQTPVPNQNPMARQTPVPHSTPVPNQTPVPPRTGVPPQTSMPSSGSAGTQPQPPRIDQVRAELDELSDYLRKEEGR
jgi:hypothetical protein